jgi:hypothetical protein
VFIGEVTDDPRRARFLFAEAHGSEALMDRRFAAVRAIAQVMVSKPLHCSTFQKTARSSCMAPH